MTKMLPHLAAFEQSEKDWTVDPEVLSHFPAISPKVTPLGARVLCQLLSAKPKSSGGIILVEETKETEQWNLQVARVLALGPIAFCNRETGKPWQEGVWCEPGDFVVIPRWGGNRRTVTNPGSGEKVYFVTCNDHEIIEKVFGDPLKMDTYIL